jgi:4-amino-4-deoxy-L-arabinose transferase-like glycosyltransferase
LKLIVDKVLAYRKFFSHAWYSLAFLLLCRIVANFVIPLNDTTEARYAEIARKMLETGNWVTLQHDYGIPFWAKPPLSTWLSAFSMKLFGVNEFAARFPSLLLSIAVLGLVWKLAKEQMNYIAAMVAVVVLAGTFYFFLDAGAVMTEPTLIFCITLSLASFWLAVVKHRVLWSYLFFVGLGLGLLAKGPIILVLVGLPLFFWVLINHAWLSLWLRLPWIKGILLMCLIALPWYILAEYRTPGFLNYFIVGEHFQRFLTPGWAGDKYGVAHHAPKGMIWLYAAVGLLPWIGIFSFWAIKYRKALFKDNKKWMSYLILNTILPLLFFTFAGNIIYPYAFPILPVFALLFTELWQRRAIPLANSLWIPHAALIAGGLGVLAIFVFSVNPNQVSKTQKPVIQAWLHHNPSASSELLYWGSPIDFSAQFYSHGLAKSVSNMNDLCAVIKRGTELYLVVNAEHLEVIPQDLLMELNLLDRISFRKNTFLLFHLSPLKSTQMSFCS